MASNATAYRLIVRIAAEAGALERIRGAPEARTRAWRRGARSRQVVIDLDATLLIARSDKQGAAGNYRNGYGFHPMLACLDGTEQALAGRLRPGNAGANTAADKIAVLNAALAQLPKRVAAREAIRVRADGARATHELLAFCRDGWLRFSVGFDLTEAIRTAILAVGEGAWMAIGQDGEPRDDGAWVAELTDGLDLSGWPDRSRVIVRREIPHPSAQLSFTDHGDRLRSATSRPRRMTSHSSRPLLPAAAVATGTSARMPAAFPLWRCRYVAGQQPYAWRAATASSRLALKSRTANTTQNGGESDVEPVGEPR